MENDFNRRKRALVTGGTGFMGRSLVRALITNGWETTIYDRFEPADSDAVHPQAKLIVADIFDQKALANAVQDADCIFHLAGMSSVPACSQEPARAFEHNAMGTVHVLEALRESASATVFILASSALVYGGGDCIEHFTEQQPVAPASVYAASKAAAETATLQYHRSYGIDVRIARYANVYGPGQTKNILFDFCRKAHVADTTFRIEGSGNQQRDFLYVDDAAAATLDLAGIPIAGERIFNVSTGIATPVRTLAEIVCRIMGREALEIITTRQSWIGDVDIMVCDNSRLATAAPRIFTPMEVGVAAYITWLRQSRALE